MKFKRVLLLFSLIFSITISSCGQSNNVDYIDEYTVIWQNDNGDILEIDRNVSEGNIASYDGQTPTKASTNKYSYSFLRWEPEISEIHSNTTYTAIYESHINKFTITWKNYDGSVLEIDNDVAYGTLPTYDGLVPVKEGNEDVSYIFSGWSPKVEKATSDATYVATFIEKNNGEVVAGVDPVISSDNSIIEYGFYPQTHVKDEVLISELEKAEKDKNTNWYTYNGSYYIKETASIYNNENYTFDDGTSIVNGTEYWFKCETIKWQVLNVADGTYFLLSSTLLDTHNYYSNYNVRTIDGKTILPNNYEHSDIRLWLNNDFYNMAFSLNNSYIKETNVDNSALTTDSSTNDNVCNNTIDKVFLPSYKDYLNSNYKFAEASEEKSKTRECKTTDYARARGAWYSVSSSSLKYNGSYWTRSPVSEFSYCAWNVNSAGYLSSYAVDGNSHSVRPCITITIA